MKRKLPIDVLKARAMELIALQAERHLKEQARIICEGLSPVQIQKMADADLRLSDLLKETNFEVPEVHPLARPAVSYVQGLSDERMLEVLEEVAPAQVAVLRRNPQFAHLMIEDLKMLGGS